MVHEFTCWPHVGSRRRRRGNSDITSSVKFSALLREAILSADAGLDRARVERLESTILELLQGWVAVHEPDLPDDQLDDPQRALVLMLLEELADRVEIPVVE